METRPNFKGLVLNNQATYKDAVENSCQVTLAEALRAVGAPEARALAVHDGDEKTCAAL